VFFEDWGNLAKFRQRYIGPVSFDSASLVEFLQKNVGHALQRRMPFFLYVAVTVTLAGCVFYFGWVRTWSSFGVQAMYPPFIDMRVIQGAVSSLEQGYDPRIANVGDPLLRPFNYPMLWIAIGKALNFTSEGWFIAICVALVLCFVGFCATLIFRYPSFGLLASLVSTSTLLGIERGNIDLAVFCLLFCATWTSRRWSPVLVLLATLLKLYPVLALSAMFIRRQFMLFATSLAAAAAIFAYLSGQLADIRSTTHTDCYKSYGIPNIHICFTLFGWRFWLFWVLLTATGLATLGLMYSFSRSDALRPKQDLAFDLMLVGAAIYVGTFILWSNFDYRLIFLIFCIPFLQRRPFPYAHVVIVVMLTAMNQAPLHRLFGVTGLIVAQLAKNVIFAVLSAYLLALAWDTLASFYAKSKSATAATN
jgi:Glycosyltransferase family 87